MVQGQRVVSGRDGVEHLRPAPRGRELRGKVGASRKVVRRPGPEEPDDDHGNDHDVGDRHRRSRRQPVSERDPGEAERHAAEQQREDEGEGDDAEHGGRW